jgi:two-component system, NtrC family, response regulator HydG
MQPRMTARLILIVDDEAAHGRMLAEALAEAGWQASAATGLDEALELLVGGRYRVVLCDLRIRNGDGFSLLRAVRARAHSAAVILMSSFGNEDTLRRALTAGAFAYLAKPFALEQLFPLLELAQRATATH